MICMSNLLCVFLFLFFVESVSMREIVKKRVSTWWLTLFIEGGRSVQRGGRL